MAGSLTINTLNGVDISASPVTTESQVIGVGQTWQDVTASRVLGTTYTNSTGKPILVAILATNSVPYNITLTISGLAIPQAGYGSGGGYTGATFLVPNGAAYVLSGVTTINKWIELR